MRSSIILLFAVLVTTCFYTANTQDDYDYDYGEEDNNTDPPPDTTTAPSTGSGTCSNILTPMSECELPQPALKARLKTEEDALLLADCWLHCLDMFLPESNISDITELEGFPTLKTVPASFLNSGNFANRIQVLECRRGCEARAFDPQRTTQDCTTACVDNCEHYYREERCLRNKFLLDGCNRDLCQMGCAFQSGMPQRVPIAPTHVPELNPPVCKERAGVYHIGNVSTFTKLNASFNPSGYTTYVFRVQSMDNASLSTYIWLQESTHRLLLSNFACSNVSISYAVVSRTNMTQYSPVLNLSVYGANQDPDNGFPHQVDYRSVTRELELDDRSQFIRKYWTFRFSWERPIGNLTGYKIDVNYQSFHGSGSMSHNLSKDVTSFTFFSDSNTSIFLSARSTISRLQITTLPMAVNIQPTVIECLHALPDIQQVINHTTLQLTCVSQWNSSRYQYNTALRFNLSEPSFVALIDLFYITEVLINKAGVFASTPRLLTQINPRTSNNTQNGFTYQGNYQDPNDDASYQFRLTASYRTDNQQLPPLADDCLISLVPPSPQPPANVTVQSSSIIEHNPSSFVVSIDFVLQQPNDTSAHIKDLKHEYIITTSPITDSANSTNLNGVTPITATLVEDEFQGTINILYTSVQENANFTCLYLQLRSMYSVPTLQNQFFRSVWSSPVVLYRSPDQTNCSLPFDDSIDFGSGASPAPTDSLVTVIDTFFINPGESTTSPTPTGVTDYSTRTIVLSVLVPLAIIVLLVSMLIIFFCFLVIKRRRKMNYESYNGDRAYKEMQLIFSGKHNGSTECSYEQADSILQVDDWELSPEDIVIDEKLGEGAFGEVYRGIVAETHNNPRLEGFLVRSGSGYVALKFLKEGASGSERLDFIKEIELMKKIANGNNSHVVNMVGCITIQEPLCLVTEFVKHGDLQTFLRTCRKQFIERKRNPETAESPYSDLGELKSEDLVSFAYQIASGMEFLASLNVIHRDLACRNILVGQGKALKITDFGLSRLLLHDNVYVKTTQGRMPLKWMSIESIVDREYTTASDVWSYGVTLWEIATLGSMPYPTINNEDMLVMLKRGYRMERPENCSVEVYQLMLQCWQEHPNDRPNFVQLRGEFDRMLSKQKNAEELYIFIQAEEMMPAEETPLESKITKLELDEKPADTARVEMDDDGRPVNPYVDQPVATTPVDPQHYLSRSVGGTSCSLALTPK